MAVNDVTLRPLADDEMERLLLAPWSSGLKEKHRQRLARQRDGEACYLLAWRGDEPIGHLLIKWSGPGDERVAGLVEQCAEIEDFVVSPGLRSRGIGRAMLGAATELARGRGMRRVGLAVGFDNPRAQALYERLGFADAGCGEVLVRWLGAGPGGETRWYEQRCTYLVKELAQG